MEVEVSIKVSSAAGTPLDWLALTGKADGVELFTETGVTLPGAASDAFGVGVWEAFGSCVCDDKRDRTSSNVPTSLAGPLEPVRGLFVTAEGSEAV